MIEQEEKANQPPKITFADIPYDTIWEITRRTGGYTVYDPEELVDIGIPQELITLLIREHNISKDGQIPVTRRGVGGFDLLNKICDDLGIEKETFFSDIGNQAADFVQQITLRVEGRMSPDAIPPLFKNMFTES